MQNKSVITVKKSKKHLLQYSALAATFLVAGNLESQVVYHDVDPDIDIAGDCDGQTYHLDLNLDGNNDFDINFNFCNVSSITPLFVQASVSPAGSNSIAFSNYILSFWGCFSTETFTDHVVPVIGGGSIDAGLNFTNAPVDLWKIYENTSPCATTNFFGSWLGANNKFVPLKFKFGGNNYYGWVRISIPEFSPYFGEHVIVHDFAYQATPDVPIPASLTFVDPATTVNATVIGTAGDGSDIQFTFNSAASEIPVAGYRVIAVKSIDASDFNISLAYLLNTDQYINVAADGSLSHTGTFTPLSKDSEGDLITGSIPYKLFVISAADPASGDASILSAPSADIILSGTGAPGVGYLFTADVNSFFDSRDFEISFSPVNTTDVSEYRIIIVKDAATLSLPEAESLPSDLYYSVLPSDLAPDTAHVFIDVVMNDADGDPVVAGQYYQTYLVSMANGVTTLTNTLSGPSNTIILQEPTNAVIGITVSDIGDAGDGNDLHITFLKADPEVAIGEYRGFIVPVSEAATFDISVAESILSGNYFSIIPSGIDIAYTGSSLTNDMNGNPVMNDQPYIIFIASMADPLYGTSNVLSAPSAEITLTSVSTGPETALATNVVATDVSNNVNGTDLQVSFTKGIDESTITRYEIMVVPDALSGGFGENDAENISSTGEYFEVLPTGSDIVTVLSDTSNDIKGHPITNDKTYYVFVHSIDNGTGNGDTLSAPSNAITLTNVIASVQNNSLQAAIFSNENMLTVNMQNPVNEVSISVYDAEGKVVFRTLTSEQFNKFPLDLPSGIYFVNVNASDLWMGKKIFLK